MQPPPYGQPPAGGYPPGPPAQPQGYGPPGAYGYGAPQQQPPQQKKGCSAVVIVLVVLVVVLMLGFGGCVLWLVMADTGEIASAGDDHMTVCKNACDKIAECGKSGELPAKGGDIEAERTKCKKDCPTNPSEEHKKMYRELAPCLDKSCSDMMACTLEVAVRHSPMMKGKK